MPGVRVPTSVDGGVEYKELDTTAGTASNIHNPVSGSVFYVLGMQGSLNTLGGTLWIEDTDATQLTGKIAIAGNTPVSINPPHGAALCKAAVSKGIAVNTTAGGFHGVVQFYEVTNPT